jgi:hypothetical protein
MKIIHFKNFNRMVGALIGLLVITVLLLNVVGYFLDLKYVSIFAAMAQANQCEIKSQLLMEAMKEVGLCEPESTVRVWASGLEKRSAALQYAALSNSLKDEYAKQLQQSFPNWVTGVSSPFISGYEIIKRQEINKNSFIYHIRFDTKTSTGPADSYNASLTVELEKGFWRITKITADKQLNVYTGFLPI